MATLFPSVFLSPAKTRKHHFSLLRSRSTLSFINSLSSSESNPLPSSVRALWDWFSKEGVISSKTPVKPGVVPEGLGLIATRDIAENDVILEVPRRFWVNPDTVEYSEIGKVCDGLNPWVSVALFLVREKLREDSKWKIYLDVLPETTDATIFWSDEELSELEGTQLLCTTLSVKEYVQMEFMKAEAEIIIPNRQLFPSAITLNDFFWAFGILRSRAFSRLQGQNLVVIPLIDLINHSAGITSEDHIHERTGPAGLFSWDLLFSLRTTVSVTAGEQVKCPKSSNASVKMMFIKVVFIQYGLKKTNSELALDYGFIESTPHRNAYSLTLEVPCSDPFFRDKLDITKLNGLDETTDFEILLGHPLPPKMLPFLRLIALGGTDAFLLDPSLRNSVWGCLEFPVSHANEKIICNVVRDACKYALSCYPTTIDEDEKLMTEGNLRPRLWIAVGIRSGEKKVLHQIDGIFKERELKLDQLEYYKERMLKELCQVGEKGESIPSESK
ncbi:SET domain [Dillenia turbinata]|uniref:SET domain n=1 Tax=Dillenia turbinata TaxID=194707 RepID=A0AAN8VJX4_9MAGN